MTILLDSNFLFAIKSEKDKYHQRAIEILNDLQKDDKKLIVTNCLVINETFTLTIARSKAATLLIEKIYELFWGQENFFKIIQLTLKEYNEVYKILKKYCTPKRLLSFVDASLIYMFEKFNAMYIISFDNHFDNITNRLF